MKNKFTNAFNDVDARYILEAEPGNSRPKASILRKKWLIAAVAAVLVAAILIPVAVAFANKAPEPGTPVIAVTETKKETPEKTETPVVAPTPTVTVFVTPTTIETETPVETPTPTETPVVTPTQTESPTEIPTKGNNSHGGMPSLSIAPMDLPVAIIQITEVTDNTKNAYLNGHYDECDVIPCVEVVCDIIYASNIIDRYYAMNENGQLVEMQNDFSVPLKLKKRMFIPQIEQDYIYVDSILFCLVEYVETGYYAPTYDLSRIRFYAASLIPFVNNGLVLDNNRRILFQEYYRNTFHDMTFVNTYLSEYQKIAQEKNYTDGFYENLPTKLIENGTTVEELISILEWNHRYLEVFYPELVKERINQGIMH